MDDLMPLEDEINFLREAALRCERRRDTWRQRGSRENGKAFEIVRGHFQNELETAEEELHERKNQLSLEEAAREGRDGPNG